MLRIMIAASSLASCAMSGTYLGARTPPRGTWSTGVVLRAAAGRNAVPFPTADVVASYAPTDDASCHLRAMVASLGVEAMVRWRVVRTGRLHIALAPTLAVAYWPASRGVEEDDSYRDLGAGANALARLSVLASLELGRVDLDLAGFAGVSRITSGAVPAGDDAPYAVFAYELQGLTSIAGAALGVTLPAPRGARIRPAVEWMRFVDRHRAGGPDQPAFAREDLWTVTMTWER